jgi:hypothetical protein
VTNEPPRPIWQLADVTEVRTPHGFNVLGVVALVLVAVAWVIGFVSFLQGANLATTWMQWLLLVSLLIDVAGLTCGVLAMKRAVRLCLARYPAAIAVAIGMSAPWFLLALLSL